MQKFIDLHTHSTASDGTCSPAELVKEAKEAGLSAVAITDHDSVSGHKEALLAGKQYGIEVIPGIELSTTCPINEEEVHVVGLYVSDSNHILNHKLKAFVENRDNRNLQIIKRLQQEGYSITAEEIYAKNPDTVIARPHLARHLVDTGQMPDIKSVFNKLLGDGCLCFVDRMKITPVEAVELIQEAGGTAILAHPTLYHMPRKELLQMIDEMTAAGLEGIEAIYSCNQGSDELDYTNMAKERGLLISGGSDFHGNNKSHIHLGTGRGNLKIPYELLEKIKAYRTEKGQPV